MDLKITDTMVESENGAFVLADIGAVFMKRPWIYGEIGWSLLILPPIIVIMEGPTWSTVICAVIAFVFGLSFAFAPLHRVVLLYKGKKYMLMNELSRKDAEDIRDQVVAAVSAAKASTL